MRPRGESASTPSTRYVGHAGRQSPQCTQSSVRVYASTASCADTPVGTTAVAVVAPPPRPAAARTPCPAEGPAPRPAGGSAEDAIGIECSAQAVGEPPLPGVERRAAAAALGRAVHDAGLDREGGQRREQRVGRRRPREDGLEAPAAVP